MESYINWDWDAIKSFSLTDFQGIKKDGDLVELFVKNKKEVNHSLDLLSKVVLILSDKLIDNESLNKISSVFAKSINIEKKTIITERAEKLLDSSNDLWKMHTQLTFACNFCDIELFKKIANLENINTRNSQGQTPLMVAALNGRPEIVKFLIENGADKNLVTQNKWSALHYACINGPMESVELLITKENVNAQTDLGFTPLLIACTFGKTEIAKLLIGKGAKTDISDHSKSIALHVACMFGNKELVALLITEENINAQTSEGFTPLMLACSKGRTEIGKYLIGKGAKTDILDQNKWSVLHVACKYGNKDLVERLVTAENINKQTSQGLTPLMIACMKNHVEIVKSLLNRGANKDIVDGRKNNALSYSITGGYIEVVKLLVTQDNVNRAVDGFTPLMIANMGKHADIIEFLLNQGADFKANFDRISTWNSLSKVKYICPFLNIKESVKSVDIDSAVKSIYEQYEKEKILENLIFFLSTFNNIHALEKLIKGAIYFNSIFGDIFTFMKYYDECLLCDKKSEEKLLSPKNSGYESKKNSENFKKAKKLHVNLESALIQARIRLEKLKSPAREELENKFREKGISQILFEWGIGGQPKPGNDMELESALDEPCQEYLGIPNREYLTIMGIETGQDLMDKVGINIDLEILIDSVSNKGELKKSIKESLEVKMEEEFVLASDKFEKLYQRLENEELSEKFLNELKKEEIDFNIVSLKSYLTEDFTQREVKKQRLENSETKV